MFVGKGGVDEMEGLEGNDVFCGGSGEDVIFGDEGRDRLNGGSESDIVAGGDGADVLAGGLGSVDALLPGQGKDLVRGGPGEADVASYLLAPTGVRVNLATGRSAGGDDADKLEGVEGIQGSPANDVLVGSSGTNFLIGAPGADGNDQMDGGQGLDVALFSFAEHPMEVQLGVAGVATGQGNDQLDGIEAASGGPLNDAIGGNGKANLLFGDDGDDELIGSGGADYLSGGDGGDELRGGTGEDVLSGEEGDDDLVGDAGSDEVTYVTAPDSVVVDLNLGGAIGQGFDLLTGVEQVVGSNFADDLSGDEGSNRLNGGAGSDILSGLDGADGLSGGEGNDQISGGVGDDSISGGAGPNSVDGGAGTDQCFEPATAPACETGVGGTPDSLDPAKAPKLPSGLPPSVAPKPSRSIEPRSHILLTFAASGSSQCVGNQIIVPRPLNASQVVGLPGGTERIYWTSQVQRYTTAGWRNVASANWAAATIYASMGGSIVSTVPEQSWTINQGGYYRILLWVYWPSVREYRYRYAEHSVFRNSGGLPHFEYPSYCTF